MSRIFLRDTEHFTYENVMQQRPRNICIIPKQKTKYISLLMRYMIDDGYGEIFTRISESLYTMVYDDFIFLSTEHKDRFWRMIDKQRKYMKNAHLANNKIAVIYLLSSFGVFSEILDSYIFNPSYIMPKVFKGNLSEKCYTFFLEAKHLMGLGSGISDEDLIDQSLIEDELCGVIFTAKMIYAYGPDIHREVMSIPFGYNYSNSAYRRV